MNARRKVKYWMWSLFRRVMRHKRPAIIVGDVMLVLLLAWQLMPVSQREVVRDKVDMRIETYYEVTADGHPVFFFADINDTLEASGGSVCADTITTHKIDAPGFWVNKIPLVPSCMGHIVTFAPPKPKSIVKMDSAQLRRFVIMQMIRSDNRLAGLQRMRNELHYYVRKHDIADYGYGQIAKFSSVIDKQVDSLERIVDTLQNISPKARIGIRFVTRYAALKTADGHDTINRRCRIVEDYHGQFCLVRTLSGTTPLFVAPRMSITRGMEELLKLPVPDEKRPTKTSHKGTVDKMVIDSVGTYVGQVAADTAQSVRKRGSGGLVPSGLGKMFYDDGSYYEGYWERGMRNGFGFYVSPSDYLQAGTWKNNVFKGERLTYNANRIYGIDLSRHQHEHDGKKYDIDWSRLRITSLGSAAKDNVSGKVDYPVSFIYIKSTEGCTVLNSYYYADYAMARSKGMRVGSYHFFSTTSSGYDQAMAFLRKSRFSNGDLAPVLDVEPTDAQVEKMGGSGVLLSNVARWLETVYKHTGQRPILYVGQTFAHKYLHDATAITGNYLVWVARYSEYMPTLKLAMWQLAPDGRVDGIHGNVDINVFSGYRQEYDDFLRSHTIRK